MANGNGNGNGSSMVVLVVAVLMSVFLILGFMVVLIIWGGVQPDTVLPILVPGVMVALAFLWKSFQDREVARQIKEARADIAANTVRMEGVAQVAGVLQSDVGQLKSAVDGMTTKLVLAEVGKERAEGETKAAVLALDTAVELAEAFATPSTVTPEVQPVTIVDEVVKVDVVEKGGR